jgi:arylsulfatase A-like enzyme
MRRNILFITTDQQRYDALGCNGGRIARTPVADRWAVEGIRYTRAHVQNVVCMPSRATMVTGQHVSSHGVWANGVALPAETPNVAALLRDAGYRTGLIGKAHFEPATVLSFPENRMAMAGSTGPHRGFDHMELTMHGPQPFWHYGRWLMAKAPAVAAGFYPVVRQGADGKLMVNADGGGDTGACQVKHNPVARALYHTDWVAERAEAFLDGIDGDQPWFLWASFPDPHHPWDPPQAELARHPWRDLDLPDFYPGSAEAARALLAAKPHHWADWFEGRVVSNFEAPPDFVPAAVTPDQFREINAAIHVKNELIDEACGRIWDAVKARGWDRNTDIVFTTDHGEFQGEFGLLFKGPYHVDALMRVPLFWRPAAMAEARPAVVDSPVGLVDLAPTFCRIAGLPAPDWMEGSVLPADAAAAVTRKPYVFTEWDSELGAVSLHLKSVCAEGFLLTLYERSSEYDGSEGELYDLARDPGQRVNCWDDPDFQAVRRRMTALIDTELPNRHAPKRLPQVAMV